MTKRKRERERWPEGTELWQVPIRFYDDPTPAPERCVVVRDDSKHDYDDEFSLYGFHDDYGHNVYLNPDDLYPTLAECNAEAARRRAMKEAEHKADVDRIMESINKATSKEERRRTMFDAIKRGWAEGDRRRPGRFRDALRFAPKDAKRSVPR